MRYLCDNMRHLICEPFSLEGLHLMAEALNIKRCWFHNGGSGRMKGCFPHYDIPKKRIEEIQAKCEVVDPRVIHSILKEWAHKNNKWPSQQTSTLIFQPASSPKTSSPGLEQVE